MGWWSKRQRESGRFGGVKKGRKLGPKKKITELLYIPDTIMSPARVKFECGHEGLTYAGRSAPAIGMYGHCRKCITLTFPQHAAEVVSHNFGNRLVKLAMAVCEIVEEKGSFNLNDFDPVKFEANVDDLLAVLGLLGGKSNLLVIEGKHEVSGEIVSEREFFTTVRKWWRNEGVSDEQWKTWSRSVTLSWKKP